MVLSLSIGIILSLIADHFIPGQYVDNIFIGDFNEGTSIFKIIDRVGVIIMYIGIFSFVLTIEYSIKRTKYIFSLMSLSFIALLIISTWEIYFMIVPIASTYHTVLIILILLIFAKWSKRELKVIAFMIIYGILLLVLAQNLYSTGGRELNFTPLFIAPILWILGVIFMSSPAIIKPEKYSETEIYWKVSSFIITLLVWIFVIVFTYIGVYTVLLEIPTAISTYVIVIIISFIPFSISKIFTTSIVEAEQDKSANILGIFSRPQKLTEEEVSVAKEKKICLVCKGKIARYDIYICPECDSLYHQKCAKTLEGLENACWACEVPFDESKPVKLAKKEEEKQVEIEQEVHKSKKLY